MKRTLTCFAILSLFSFLLTTAVYARSGCCSYHEGVRADGCGCNDGTPLSSTCAPYYSCYAPQQNTAPITNSSTSDELQSFITAFGSSTYINNEDQTVDVVFSFADNNPTQYSWGINKYASVDPGPIADTGSPIFTFKNIAAGNWYVNVKKLINGYWSGVYNWKITVPAWVSPTPLPTPTPQETVESNTTNGDNNTGTVIIYLIIGALIIYIAYEYGKTRK